MVLLPALHANSHSDSVGSLYVNPFSLSIVMLDNLLQNSIASSQETDSTGKLSVSICCTNLHPSPYLEKYEGLICITFMYSACVTGYMDI